MPLARGLMIMDRLNVYNTSTAVSVMEIPPYTCGETIHFNVTVTNTTSGTPVPPNGSTVQIFDLVSSTVLGSGTLVSGSVTIPVTLSSGSINVIARYLGTSSNPIFNPSLSSNIPISPGTITTTTTLTAPSNHVHFCSGSDLTFTATVPGATGNVQFYYSLDTITFTLFATAALSSGTANATLPGGTITGSSGGSEVYFQAVYVGNACFNPSSSAVQDGYAYNSQVTTSTITVPMDSPGIGYYTTHPNQPVNSPGVTVNVAAPLTVNDGYVLLYYAFEASGTPPDFTLPTPPSPWGLVPVGSGSGADANPIFVSGGNVVFNFDQVDGLSFFSETNGAYYFVAIYYDTTDTCYLGSHTTFSGTSAYHIFVNEE